MFRILTALLLLTVALTPLAAADESNADCEEGQWWIGYRATRPVQELAEGALAGTGVGVAACEGEQWDGQDPVAPDEPAACPACMGADPNGAPSDDPLNPAGARASADADGGAYEVYAAANVAFVGRAAVYVGACDGGAGLEGASECGGTRELRTGLYARDNTPGNFLATMTQCAFSVTGCVPTEADCDQATYHQGQKENARYCGRDNTALGLMLVLA